MVEVISSKQRKTSNAPLTILEDKFNLTCGSGQAAAFGSKEKREGCLSHRTKIPRPFPAFHQLK
jgi:hypothetical protein